MSVVTPVLAYCATHRDQSCNMYTYVDLNVINVFILF